MLTRATKEIRMTRGDTEQHELALKMDGEVYEMEEGDQINFGVKKSYEDNKKEYERLFSEHKL